MHALKEAKQTLDNLRACLQFIGHPLTHASVTNFKPILKAIAVAFCTCSTVQTQHDVYRNVYERAPGLIHPLSSLLGQGYEWVVYDEYYLRGRKQYHEMVTAVNPEWLLDQPFLADERLSRKPNGDLRQPQVRESLDAARLRLPSSSNN